MAGDDAGDDDDKADEGVTDRWERGLSAGGQVRSFPQPRPLWQLHLLCLCGTRRRSDSACVCERSSGTVVATPCGPGAPGSG